MVQPASQYSCILAPAFAWGTAMCQPVYDLANKISTCVSSIFAAIADFVLSCLCCSSAAPTPAATVDPAQGGRNFLLSLMERHDREDLSGTDLYSHQMDSLFGSPGNGGPNLATQNPGLARTFLARLVVHDLVISGLRDPIPLFVARNIGDTSETYIHQIQVLRNDFIALSAEERAVVIDRFDQNIEIANTSFTNADIFLRRAYTLVGQFLDLNSHFIESADRVIIRCANGIMGYELINTPALPSDAGTGYCRNPLLGVCIAEMVGSICGRILSNSFCR